MARDLAHPAGTRRPSSMRNRVPCHSRDSDRRVLVAHPKRWRAGVDVNANGRPHDRAVCAHPGAAMTVLSAEVGATVRELHRPMTRLKRAGRVRSVGARHLTRYFPMAGKVAASA
jgi:hypothetical protein